MKRGIPILVAIAVVILSGLVHGRVADRWEQSAELSEALARVAKVPLDLGPWKGHERPCDPEMYARAGAGAYWMREYTHPGKRATVAVALLCGRAGRMATHTPDLCYQGAGYEMTGDPVHETIKFGADKASAVQRDAIQQDAIQQRAEFWTGRFVKRQAHALELRLWWAWNDGVGWQAPEHPRWAFRGKPYLYKLYVIVEDAALRPEDEPMPQFLQRLLPSLHSALRELPAN